ncbi:MULTISPECIES: hypothetical protein [unclassified Nitrobacter]|nr:MULTISPECIES: hypothetical protein [unclassified Nitrobacter]MBN9149764.1 hypothetical protein [Nitrobacter sp.]
MTTDPAVARVGRPKFDTGADPETGSATRPRLWHGRRSPGCPAREVNRER